MGRLNREQAEAFQEAWPGYLQRAGFTDVDEARVVEVEAVGAAHTQTGADSALPSPRGGKPIDLS